MPDFRSVELIGCSIFGYLEGLALIVAVLHFSAYAHFRVDGLVRRRLFALRT